MSRNAQIALNKKLKLERKLLRKLQTLFRSIALGSEAVFYDPGVYLPQIESLLVDHYDEAFNVFGFDYSTRKRVKLASITKRAIESSAKDKFRQHAARQAEIITRNNIRNLQVIKRLALDQLDDLRKINPNLTFAKHVNDLYKSSLNRRSVMVTTTETQWGAEFSKENEIQQITGPGGEGSKRWDAVGDSKMRAWHAFADSQIVLVSQPFFVGGERLMHPGDTDLGATARNIVNCRCSTEYDITFGALAKA